MTRWSITPADVQSVLKDVQDSAEELGKKLTPEKFEAVLEGLTWGGPLTADVPKALGSLLTDQSRNLTNIGNRINAGTVGVANATIAYNNGQEEMAGTYQAELLKAAETGDFTYFVKHGHKG